MILDLIVILVIALFTFIGYKQGLIKVAIKIASFFIAIIIALVLFKPVSTLVINNTTIDDKIENAIIEKITPEGMKPEDKVETQNLPSGIIKNANDSIKNIAETLTTKLIEICTILILYIVARIVLKFIAALATLIEKIPILKQFNKLGGTVYGLVKGVLIVYVILSIIYLASPLLKENTSKKIEEARLTKMMYNNNIITKIML